MILEQSTYSAASVMVWRLWRSRLSRYPPCSSLLRSGRAHSRLCSLINKIQPSARPPYWSGGAVTSLPRPMTQRLHVSFTGVSTCFFYLSVQRERETRVELGVPDGGGCARYETLLVPGEERRPSPCVIYSLYERPSPSRAIHSRAHARRRLHFSVRIHGIDLKGRRGSESLLSPSTDRLGGALGRESK